MCSATRGCWPKADPGAADCPEPPTRGLLSRWQPALVVEDRAAGRLVILLDDREGLPARSGVAPPDAARDADLSDLAAAAQA